MSVTASDYPFEVVRPGIERLLLLGPLLVEVVGPGNPALGVRHVVEHRLRVFDPDAKLAAAGRQRAPQVVVDPAGDHAGSGQPVDRLVERLLSLAETRDRGAPVGGEDEAAQVSPAAGSSIGIERIWWVIGTTCRSLFLVRDVGMIHSSRSRSISSQRMPSPPRSRWPVRSSSRTSASNTRASFGTAATSVRISDLSSTRSRFGSGNGLVRLFMGESSSRSCFMPQVNIRLSHLCSLGRRTGCGRRRARAWP